MPEYKAPLRDVRFVLFELLKMDAHYARIPGAEDLNQEVVEAILSEAAKLAENVLAPLNQSGDEEGCHWSEQGVKTPEGFKAAYDTFCESGLGGISANVDYGGQGLPPSMATVLQEMWAASNTSFSMYPGLTNGAIALLDQHGTKGQKDQYLEKMISGEWSGTMCLTESHCGTDLGLLRTKATPNDDGSYAISGEKIFISAGEHDFTSNIVHMVLARLPDAPPGTKGISLFIVPKYLPAADGSAGEANGVHCASIEHKMGIKASSTCVMTFDDSKGFLVGEPHKGLRCMFVMMNVARIGTGMQGMAQGEASRQGAVRYAQERLQMRSLKGAQFPDKPADPIIVHPDVRRMLLTQRAFAEGSRALAYYCVKQADISRAFAGTPEAEEADALMELLTPICKAFMTDTGFESTNLGVQVFGGHGFIREWGMEQLVRDARILQLYEGANGIQALDLLGRKVLGNGLVTLKSFCGMIEAFCEEHRSDSALAEFVEPLSALSKEWVELAEKILELALQNPEEAGAASYDFLSFGGYVCFAYMFARSVVVAQRQLAEGSDEADFYGAKVQTARFFYQRLLPRTRGLVVSMLAGAGSLMEMTPQQFEL